MTDNKTNNDNSNDNSKFFCLEIYTPTDMFLACKIRSVTVPSIIGAFQVLVNHAPILVAIESGIVTYIDEKSEPHILFVENGMAEVKNNVVVFTVASAEKLEDIEISQIEQLICEMCETNLNLALIRTNLKDITRINMNKKIELMKQKIKAVQNLN
ncbi:MAG: F0F1 ATP synthase subunit epsilon [Firmicutes bacterium]|nr:F0F1 ATP synthase subunit epsilon [Bacillota bacterium]